MAQRYLYRQKKGFRVEKIKRTIEQNLQETKGREVNFADMLKHRNPNCTACWGVGSGYWGKATKSPCACAQKRFYKAERERLIVNAEGKVWWIKDQEPEWRSPTATAST